MVEIWEIGEWCFEVYIGNFGLCGVEGKVLLLLVGLFLSIEWVICIELLDVCLYWFWYFFCVFGN